MTPFLAVRKKVKRPTTASFPLMSKETPAAVAQRDKDHEQASPS